jgi:hypothetical protein
VLRSYVRCPIFLSKFRVSRQIFIHAANIKFYRNTRSGSRADTCWRTDRRTNMTRLKEVFVNTRMCLKLNDYIDTVVFWHLTSQSVAYVYLCVGGTYCLHLWIRWIWGKYFLTKKNTGNQTPQNVVSHPRRLHLNIHQLDNPASHINDFLIQYTVFVCVQYTTQLDPTFDSNLFQKVHQYMYTIN